jgi:xanthine/uracil permease
MIQHTHNEEEDNNRNKKLILVAAVFVVYSILERIFSQFDSKFVLLLVMIGGAFFAKEKGYLDVGLEKATSLISKIKHQ